MSRNLVMIRLFAKGTFGRSTALVVAGALEMEVELKLCFMATVLFVAVPAFARADELSCISTTFNFLSPNDKVCVADFDDPKVPGVTCHISQARKGGWGQPLGLNEDPSNFSVACRQTGPINVDIAKLPDD